MDVALLGAQQGFKSVVKDAVRDSMGGFEVTPPEVLLRNLAIGLGLALVMRWHFGVFGSTFSNRREFGRVFVLIMMTTILVISVVKSALALSLGLVGALSIVRFRTPIKEPEELGYLFLTIGIGVGLGANLWIQSTVAAAAILLAMAAVQWSGKRSSGKGLFLSIEWQLPSSESRPLDTIHRILGQHASQNDLRRVDAQDDRFDATYFLDVTRIDQVGDIIAGLREGCPGITVTVIDQNRMPSV